MDGGFLRVALDMDADRDDIARADRAVRAATPEGIECAVSALTKHDLPLWRKNRERRTNDPASLDERRSKRAEDAILEAIETRTDFCEAMCDDCKKRMEYMATSFGLDEPYNDKVLSLLLFASEGWEEPPFKLATDIGWLWRGYCLAYHVASSIRGARNTSQQPTIPRLAEGGGEGLCRS